MDAEEKKSQRQPDVLISGLTRSVGVLEKTQKIDVENSIKNVQIKYLHFILIFFY